MDQIIPYPSKKGKFIRTAEGSDISWPEQMRRPGKDLKKYEKSIFSAGNREYNQPVKTDAMVSPFMIR
jgi:hypothetical protein